MGQPINFWPDFISPFWRQRVPEKRPPQNSNPRNASFRIEKTSKRPWKTRTKKDCQMYVFVRTWNDLNKPRMNVEHAENVLQRQLGRKGGSRVFWTSEYQIFTQRVVVSCWNGADHVRGRDTLRSGISCEKRNTLDCFPFENLCDLAPPSQSIVFALRKLALNNCFSFE